MARRFRKRRRYQQPRPTPVHHIRLRLPRVEITADRKWYVIRTMAQMDRRFEREATELGFQTYIPTLVEQRPRRGKLVESPVYPAAGYVFAGTQGASECVWQL